MKSKHEIEWQVEGSDMTHTIPNGAMVVFWVERSNGPNEERNVKIKYTSNPYGEEDPALEIILPNGKTVVVNPYECTISQE